jgi:PAS domain S-box-containing protein
VRGPARDRGRRAAAERARSGIIRRRVREYARDEGTALLEEIVENLPVAVWVRSVGGGYTLVNRRALENLGRGREEVLGRTPGELGGTVAAERSDAAERQVVESGEAVETVERYELGGAERVFTLMRFPVRDASGAIYAIGGIALDVTERVAAEEERARLQEQFGHTERLRTVGQLAGGLAHDFNDLLAVISNYASFVAAEVPAGSPVAEDVDQILLAARQAAELTRRLHGQRHAGRCPRARRGAVLHDEAGRREPGARAVERAGDRRRRGRQAGDRVRAGPGHTVVAWLPAAAAPDGGPARDGDATAARSVLVVEDQAPVAEVTRRILASGGHDVRACASAEEALALVGERGLRPDVLVTDVVMPGLSGPELTAALRERLPGCPSCSCRASARTAWRSSTPPGPRPSSSPSRSPGCSCSRRSRRYCTGRDDAPRFPRRNRLRTGCRPSGSSPPTTIRSTGRASCVRSANTRGWSWSARRPAAARRLPRSSCWRPRSR